jgi:hypothetical protein
MYHPTKEQMRRENYLFVKGQYWDLILFFLKRPQTDHTKKCIEDLQNGWKEWEREDRELNKKVV